MRLDKYLKVARIIKRRIIAKELASQERLWLNGRKAKASSEVKINDEVKIIFGNRILTVQVLAMPKQANKQDAQLMFKVLSEEKIQGENDE